MEEKRRSSIGVMIGGVYTHFPREVIKGIRKSAEEEDVNVFFFLRIHTNPFFRRILGDIGDNVYDYQFNTIHDYCRIGGLDGMIINYGTIGFHMNRDNAAEFIAQYNDIPLLIVTESVDVPNTYSIISDNHQGMFDVVEHLITVHGCKKILFMRGPQSNTDANERLQGYLDAMAKYNLPVDESMIGQGDFSEFVDEMVEQLLDAHPDAQALAFSNDEMASSGYRVCQRRGIAIGKDLLITGYDSNEMSDKMIPPLTTVLQDAYGMGKRSLHNLMRILEGKTLPEERYPVRLVERESCGCTSQKAREEAVPESSKEALKRLRIEAAAREQEYAEYQGKSWYIPMMARELSECAEDESKFARMVMEQMKILKSNAAYLFLLDQPVEYDGTSEWTCPDNLRLASYYRKGEVYAYPSFNRPKVTRENGLAQLTDDGEQHQFMVFLLFSGEKQYGLLVCDVPLEEQSFYYVVSLQIGLSLRYFEMNRMEATLRHQMSRDMEMVLEKNRELDMISAYDELTGLLNFRGMMEKVRQMCEDGVARRVYAVYCDLDHLKEINDTWGHHEGNYAIKTCAHVLRKCIRETDLLARVGGDEFVCLITSDVESFPSVFLERLKRSCKNINEVSNKPFFIEMSAGVEAFTLRTYEDFRDASARADKRMYEAKRERRTTIRKQIAINTERNAET